MLDIAFYQKLKQICSELQMKPEDLLLIMTMESGISGSARNSGTNASGLIQFMPSTLKNLGFTEGHDKFREMDEVKQLDYVKQYIQGLMSANGGPFKSAARCYVAVLYPIALGLPGVRSENMDTPIMSRDGSVPKYKNKSITPAKISKAYSQNSGLDGDKDGVITYGDLNRKMEGLKRHPKYKEAILGLQSVDGLTKPEDPMTRTESDQVASSDREDLSGSSKEIISEPKSFIAQMFSSLTNMWKSFASDEFGTYIVKVAGGSEAEVLEYSRIVQAAIEEQLKCASPIYYDNLTSDILVNCEYGKNNEIFVKQISDYFTKEFNKKYASNLSSTVTKFSISEKPIAKQSKIEKAYLSFRK